MIMMLYRFDFNDRFDLESTLETLDNLVFKLK